MGSNKWRDLQKLSAQFMLNSGRSVPRQKPTQVVERKGLEPTPSTAENDEK